MSEDITKEKNTCKIQIHIRLSPYENKILQEYSAKTQRSQTEIIRTLIRNLARKL